MSLSNSFIHLHRRLFRYINDFRLLVTVALVILTLGYVFIPFRVDGLSMAPTYRHSSVHICFHVAYWFTKPKRGDIVLATTDELLVKRVIALPGESVSFKDGQTFINGTYLVEPYMRFNWDWNMEPITVEPDHIFIVGDNREMEIFQHSFGQIPIDQLLGKVVY